MSRINFSRRAFVVAGATIALAGCQVVPKTTAPTAAPPPSEPIAGPSAQVLPTDETRHRVALLVPMSGENAAVGQSLANATTMALLDTNADNLRITSYDTARGAGDAARKAIADGNKLILGPLMRENVGAVARIARPADVPVISFSNDATVAGGNVFVLGHVPEQSITRSVQYAAANGATTFAAIIPNGDYGERAEAALQSSVRAVGGNIVAQEKYSRGNTSIVSAAQRLQTRGGFDAVLIAEGPRLAARAANEMTGQGVATQLMGTELWSGEAGVARTASLNGAIFSAVSDKRYRTFANAYEQRFGGAPFRVGRLGYDAVLLTLRVANDWRVGQTFPISALRQDGGFVGIDGPFRFTGSAVAERAMEVRKVENGKISIVAAAPTRFDD